MTVERKGSFSESRKAEVNLLGALLGRRAWFELPPGSHTRNDRLTVIDEDTVQVRENILPLSHTAWPIDSIKTYRGAAINGLPGLCWRGDPEKVKPSVTRDSEVYIPEDHKEQLAERDRAYLRKHFPSDL